MARPDHQLDATIEVVTPEHIAFRYRVAGPFHRLAALLMDYAIKVLGYGGVAFFLMIVLAFVQFLIPSFRVVNQFLMSIAMAMFLVGWFVIDWFYGGVLEAYWNGQTVGKRVFGLRVLTTRGEPINGLQAVLRNVLRYVDLFPMLSLEMFNSPQEFFSDSDRMPSAYMIPTLLVGLISMTLTKRYQRLGDVVCGTMVVIDERHWLTGIVKLEDERAMQLAALLPADFAISRTLARSLAMYVDRRRFFGFARRREIARHLAEPLLKRFNLPADTSYDLLLCALYYRAFVADAGNESAEIGVAPFRPGTTPAVAAPDNPYLRGAAVPPLAAPSLAASGRPTANTAG